MNYISILNFSGSYFVSFNEKQFAIVVYQIKDHLSDWVDLDQMTVKKECFLNMGFS